MHRLTFLGATEQFALNIIDIQNERKTLENSIAIHAVMEFYTRRDKNLQINLHGLRFYPE